MAYMDPQPPETSRTRIEETGLRDSWEDRVDAMEASAGVMALTESLSAAVVAAWEEEEE